MTHGCLIPRHFYLRPLAALLTAFCVPAAADTEAPPGLWEAFTQVPYAIDADGAKVKTLNHRNDQRITFQEGGINVHSTQATDTWHWGLTLTDYGTLEQIEPVAAATTHIESPRLQYRRSAFNESYTNHCLGLENGFTSENNSDPIDPAKTISSLSIPFEQNVGQFPNEVAFFQITSPAHYS